MVTQQDIQQAMRAMGLSLLPVCVHSSLKSFGHVEGGARTVIDAFLDEGCTVCVPAFTNLHVPPPPDFRVPRNGCDYDAYPQETGGVGRIYSPDSTDIAGDMGAIPQAVVAMSGRVRGNHPLCSFAAIGPLAEDLIAAQALLHVFGPLRAVADLGGFVVLMGVGLGKMTLLHLAEKVAGRNLFLRWANDSQGERQMVEVGGCSSGFGNFETALGPLIRRIQVGGSDWMVLNAKAALDAAARAIRENPNITHCGDIGCERCNDGVLGGPVLG